MGHLTDSEIAESYKPAAIQAVASGLGISPAQLVPYGRHAAKIEPSAGTPIHRQTGKLIVVTAMNATARGAGKTVTSIGLGQALGRMGARHCVCLREPSIGPTMGLKGGATGGGRAQVLPAEDINLHFTGDIHAVTTAHNLLAALVDNHIHFDNALNIDPQQVGWPRVLDLCDRQLRSISMGGTARRLGVPRRSHFDITAASEVMAILSLAQSRQDLEARIGRVIVAHDRGGDPICARQVGAVGAMSALLRHALLPNLVQTLENTPALVHCGPFANIAHGCSSVIATQLAMSHADYVITEAGFGAELGAEKFFHIKCHQANLQPSAAILVTNAPAIRHHGGLDSVAIERPDLAAFRRGLCNVRVHIENIAKFGVPVVVAHNCFVDDSADEVNALRQLCDDLGVPMEPCHAYSQGGAGAEALAAVVMDRCSGPPPRLTPLYANNASVETKLCALAHELYRADGVEWSDQARVDLEKLPSAAASNLPLCVAKTPLSLSDRKSLRGAPAGHKLRVRGLDLRQGAGFIVVRTGAIETMPGMPKEPSARHIYLDESGHVHGLR